jgi:hypothetical protein
MGAEKPGGPSEDGESPEKIDLSTTTGGSMEGAFIARLLIDRSWLVRRVETCRFTDEVSLERSITFDVDTDAVGAAYRELHGHDVEMPDLLTIPLCIINKQLLLDIDLADASGRRIHVGSRRRDRELAALALTWMRGEQAPDGTLELCQRLTGFAGADWPTDPDELSNFGLPEPVEDIFDGLELAAAPGTFQYWAGTFSDHFMLPVAVTPDSNVELYKMRLVEAGVPQRSRWSKGLKTIDVPMTDVAWCDSDHFRVEAPAGLFFSSLTVMQSNSVEGPEAARFWGRLTPSRAHIHSWGSRDNEDPGHLSGEADFTAHLRLRLPPDGLLSTARTVLFAIGALLAFGAYKLVPFVTHEGRGTPDAAITLLLVAPSAFSAYLVVGEKHPFFRDHTRAFRLLVGSASLTPIAASLAYLVWDSVFWLREFWLCLSLYCFVVEYVAVRTHARSKRAFQQVGAMAPATVAGQAVFDDDADTLRVLTSDLGLDDVCSLFDVNRSDLLEMLAPDSGGPDRAVRGRLHKLLAEAEHAADFQLGEI